MFHSLIVFWLLFLLRMMFSAQLLLLCKYPVFPLWLLFRSLCRVLYSFTKKIYQCCFIYMCKLKTYFLKLKTRNSRTFSAITFPNISFLPYTFPLPLFLPKFSLSMFFFNNTHTHTLLLLASLILTFTFIFFISSSLFDDPWKMFLFLSIF